MEPAEDLTEKPDKDIPEVSSDEQREQTEHQAEETGEDLTEDHSDEKQDALTNNEHFKKMNDGWIMISDRDN